MCEVEDTIQKQAALFTSSVQRLQKSREDLIYLKGLQELDNESVGVAKGAHHLGQ